MNYMIGSIIYITFIISITVSILGLIQAAHISIISSAVLAVLALVSVSTLANRRDNESILKGLNNISLIRQQIETNSLKFGNN